MNAATDQIIYQVDAIDESVHYNGNNIIFHPLLNESQIPEVGTRIKVQLEEGVAIPREGVECGSVKADWNVTVVGKTYFHVDLKGRPIVKKRLLFLYKNSKCYFNT